MKKQEFVNIVEENEFPSLYELNQHMSLNYGVLPTDCLEDKEKHSKFETSVDTYQLEDGIVKVRGIQEVYDEMRDPESFNYICRIVEK